ncbi:hypothetical protein TNIN_182451 [Trichonephila inaurata madagascariensis]|uniref:Uncharacterized protein n=1 Tax=Trichonephila inaurata madagascariensis TaxID=2747483 RepID=A0A8X6XPI3_9ARAC|nr:hypothetical protein TNIN_182451 [Trichonephila inaurata madagascariensis]
MILTCKNLKELWNGTCIIKNGCGLHPLKTIFVGKKKKKTMNGDAGRDFACDTIKTPITEDNTHRRKEDFFGLPMGTIIPIGSHQKQLCIPCWRLWTIRPNVTYHEGCLKSHN